MKRTSAVLFLLSLAATTSYGISATSGSSSKFIVDTRTGMLIKDVKSDYCSGSYAGQGGSRATFISGVRCDVKFTINASSMDSNPIDHYLVNGQRQDNDTFTFNVGGLPAGGQLTVVAVDGNGNETDPFRVNMVIATPPPLWGVAGQLSANVAADKFPQEGYIGYRTSEFRGFSLFDTFSDALELVDQDLPLDLTPELKLYQRMASNDGQFLEGADVGGNIGNAQIGKVQSYGHVKDKIGRFAGLNLMVGLTGGSTYNYDPNAMVWKIGSAKLGVQADASWKFRQRIPQFPLAYGEIALVATWSFMLQKQNGDWSGHISLDPFIAIRPAVGVGVDVLAEFQVAGQGGIHLEADVPGGIESMYVKAMLTWRGVLFGFERSGVWWKASHYFYQRGASLASLAPPRPSAFVMDAKDFKPIPRNYGGGGVPAARLASVGLLAASASDGARILMQNGYPTPQPSLAVAGANAALVYVRDNAARGDLDRTELVFRREQADGSWSDEVHVWDDGTADFQPKLALLPDGTAIAAWANVKRTFANDASFDSFCQSLETAVGVRDPQTGTWTCHNLTDDAAFDALPVLKGATNGTAAVAWVRNASGAYIGTSGQLSDLAVSFYRNGAWTTMSIAAPGAGIVTSHDLAWDGERAVLVWAADADGDLATDDAEIWARIFANGSWSSPVRISAASAGALHPSVWFLPDGTAHAIWVQDGALYASTGLGPASGVAVATAGEVSLPGDYRVSVHGDGSATLLWTTDPAGSESGLEGGVMSADYAPATGLAASASLLRQQSLMRNLSGVTDGDGTFRLAYEQVAVSTNAEGQIVRGAVDLAVRRHEAVRDVGVMTEDCAFASELCVGVTNNLLIGVQNHGTVAAGPFAYRVWAGEDGDKTLAASGDLSVAPLSLEVIEVPWTPEEGLTNVVFTIEVDPENAIGDSNRENNTLVWRPDVGKPQLSFRNAKAVKATSSRRLISASIHNDAVAPLPAGMEVKFWRGEIGGELLGTDTAGIVSGGTAGEYDVGTAWDISEVAFTSAWERVVIELPAEYGGQNVSVWTPTPLYNPDDDDSNDGGGGGSGGGGGGGGVSPSLPPNIGGITGFGEVDGNRCFQVYFHGEAGFTYNVQYREKLTEGDWTTILTVTPATTGEYPVAIPIQTSAPSGFFRVVTGQ